MIYWGQHLWQGPGDKWPAVLGTGLCLKASASTWQQQQTQHLTAADVSSVTLYCDQQGDTTQISLEWAVLPGCGHHTPISHLNLDHLRYCKEWCNWWLKQESHMFWKVIKLARISETGQSCIKLRDCQSCIIMLDDCDVATDQLECNMESKLNQAEETPHETLTGGHQALVDQVGDLPWMKWMQSMIYI